MIASRQIAFGKAVGKKEEPPAYWGLCFTAEENGSVVAMEAVGTAPAVTLETSYDGEIWEPFYVGETSITLNKGERIYFKAGEGGNAAMASSVGAYNRFSLITGRIAASGNVMSLLNGDMPDSVMTKSCFFRLFKDCTSLITTPELPAEKLETECYRNMFYGCTSLTTAPELPATELATYCYTGMFEGCTSLTTAPELPATKLFSTCYSVMFGDCTSLTTAPELPATTLAINCYLSMFKGCTSLTQAPELPATTLITNCYTSMFYGCTSLTTAPKMLATTNTMAFIQMFYNCKNLNFIEFPLSTFGARPLARDWVYGVSPTGTFVCPTALGTNETIQRGVSACPEGWTVINND